jgi:hypothetical protein
MRATKIHDRIVIKQPHITTQETTPLIVTVSTIEREIAFLAHHRVTQRALSKTSLSSLAIKILRTRSTQTNQNTTLAESSIRRRRGSYRHTLAETRSSAALIHNPRPGFRGRKGSWINGVQYNPSSCACTPLNAIQRRSALSFLEMLHNGVNTSPKSRRRSKLR